MSRLSVVIVSYNTRELTADCVASVFATAGDLDPEVVVVDNGSDDGSAAAIAERFPQVEVVALDDNVGFGAGANVGAGRATGAWLLFLNPDATVHDGTLQALLAFARRRPEAGLYGGRTLRPDGAVDHKSCWGLPTPWSLFCFGTGLSTAFSRSALFDPESLGPWQRDSEREVGMVSGCLLLVHRDVWQRLGGFDETYFMYAEDADLSLRARRLGYRPAIAPEVTITHVVGASTGDDAARTVMVMKGKATLLRRRWTGLRRRFGLAMLLLGVALRAALTVALRVVTRGRRGTSQAWPGVWAARREWFPGYAPHPTGVLAARS